MKNEKQYTRMDMWLMFVLGGVFGLFLGMLILLMYGYLLHTEQVHNEYCQERGFDYAQGIFSGFNGVFYTPENVPYLECCRKEKAFESLIIPEKCLGIVYK